MYKCRLTYDEWKCILSKERVGKTVKTDFFQGYIGLLKINLVEKPQVWKHNDEQITVCDDNFRWLTIMPENEYYCITAMMNEKNEIIVWYIDMLASQGCDADNVPYFYDLYLDLVVYPDGDVIEDDMDELEEALKQKDITEEQFKLAIETSRKLQNGLLRNVKEFIRYTERCYRQI
ncbi:MAG: DUF402 domain-containing protein [Lachnospiraceae bacterium]|nr:DUF402 domain-containing protein [Lachnospiraceae bacterium]